MSEVYDPDEIEWLVYHYRLGILDEQGNRRLEAILADSDEARRVAARYLLNEVVLRRELQIAEVSDLFNVDCTLRDGEALSDAKISLTQRAGVKPLQRWAPLAASILAAVVIALSVNNFTLQRELQHQQLSQPLGTQQHASHLRGESVVRLLDSTHCLWDEGAIPEGGEHRSLDPNVGLKLLEGIAELEWQGPDVGIALLQIEGPASWVFTEDGELRLSYGKVTVDSSTGAQPLSIDTPLGRIATQGHASLGVSCFGNQLEIHAFSGQAQVDSLWVGGGLPEEEVNVSVGEMVRLSIQSDVPYSITREKADSSQFASRLSMHADDLRIDHRYAAAVKQDRPLGYWRFNESSDEQIANEMGPELPIRVIGDIPLRGGTANRYAEFVDSIEEVHLDAALVTDEPISVDPLPAYTIEVWVKPSHYQQASLVGLVSGPLDGDNKMRHGMLLELAGPHPPAISSKHPGRVRFLHRFPADRYPREKESIYSQQAYELRGWQHIVVVKQPDTKQLYINGQLQAEASDTAHLSGGQTLLIGRLHQLRPERRFIGQIDELAIYDYALSPSTIEGHYRLGRPQLRPAGSRLDSI